jgi:peptide/nickel transport system ATP-binding protein
MSLGDPAMPNHVPRNCTRGGGEEDRMPVSGEAILQVAGLTTRFNLKRGTLTAVDGVSLTIRRGETFGLVGESGCGKTVTARSILRLIPIPPGEIATGKIIFEGEDLLRKSSREMRAVRGRRIAMVFQEPMSALNPVFPVSTQIADGLRHNLGLGARAARRRVIELLRLVGIPSPEKRMDDYVHQFSGGMRQRVMLAMALSCDPQFLIADEPTTALDVTVQAQILELIRQMIHRFNMSLLFITHNLGVVAHMCDTVGVMYASHLVELTDTKTLFAEPLHPYTWGLLNSIPHVESRRRYLNPIQGSVCNMLAPPTGCKFHPRCDKAMDVCRQQVPPLREVAPGHRVACHLY